MTFDIGAGVLVALAWFVREVAGLALKRTAARVGAVGYVAESFDILQEIRLADGTTRETIFLPDERFAVNDLVRLRFVGTIFNDADTPIVLHSARIAIWGTDGPRLVHIDPTLRANGEDAKVITV